MTYWEAVGCKSAMQFWLTPIIVLPIMLSIFAIIERKKGEYTGWDFLDFLSLIGSVIGWIFKGIGFLIVFIIALFRREAPSFSWHKAEDKTDYSSESDDSEDDEGGPGKRGRIDEYHV